MSDESTPTAQVTAQLEAPPDAWDTAAAWLAEHGALPGLAVLTIAMGVIFSGVFRGEIDGSDLTFHLAESRRIADCISHGDWDFWNPSANAGYASAYYYQVIPQLASAVPAALFGHHLFWFELSVWLPLVLAPLCAYRGLRLMGATPWQAVVGAFCVSFTIGQSRWGFASDGTFSVGLYTQTWAFAAFPLALGHAVRWATEGKGLAPAVVWGGFVGLCHPFAVIALGFALLFGHLARVLWVTIRSPRGPRETAPRPMLREFLRLAVFAGLLAIAMLPIILPLAIDYSGFGGFPHRVDDEVGPGFKELGRWYVGGHILDSGRITVLTWALPIVLLLSRAKFLRWLWAPALVFALLLGLGPHLGKTSDDLIPPVRFLGAMQLVLALGIGAGGFAVAQSIWNAGEDARLLRAIRFVLSRVHRWFARQPLQHPLRTALAALGAALFVLIAIGGTTTLRGRVRVLADDPASRGEMMTIIGTLATQPQGRKQVGPGCENHWWNLLSYEYARRPSLLQMGGGGLQASPNYDFLWTSRDFAKNAWLFDAPYLVFQKSSAGTMPVGDVVQQTERYEVRKLPSPGLVSPVQVTGVLPPGRKPSHEAALSWLKTELPLEDHVLGYAADGTQNAPAGTTLRAFRQDSPGDEADILAEVEVASATTFMARESWHPRWHAYIDGEEVPVRRVTPNFPAIDVPAGHHALAFRFERPWWAHASWLAWPGIALAAWLATRTLDRRRQRHTPEARVTAG